MERESDAGYHVPALLREAVELVVTNPSGTYIDATFGGGGHSRGILSALDDSGRLFGFDRDIDAAANAIDDSRFTFIHSNFRYVENFMRYHGAGLVDGIIADLGVSSHHFDSPERGFSFRADGPLDMRMNRGASLTAADIVATADEKELLNILNTYADLKRPREVARMILRAREESPIATTFRLADVVRGALDPKGEKKEMAQVFQAFRIATNNELDDLARLLEASARILKPGGRIGVITWHSGEDRMVKNFFKTGNLEGIPEKDFFGKVSTPWTLLTRKPIEPSEEEIERNPRARSARLRVARANKTTDL